MRLFFSAALLVAMLGLPGAAHAQEVAPIFEQVPAVLYETYKGVNRPGFNQYFEMLVAKYGGTGGTGWAIYNENAKVAYRITVLPEGLESVPSIQQARGASFEEFTDDQRALWDKAWGSRHVAVYNAAPRLSYVPQGFTVEDIRDLPYNRTQIYHLKWDQAAAFRNALARRAELDREMGVDFVLTAWNGGIGTEAQTVMIRVSAESNEADQVALAERMRIRRAGNWDAWAEQNQIMTDAAWHIERHDQTRVNQLSYPVRPPT